MVFWKKKIETQLILTVNDLARSVNNSSQVDAMLLGLVKAFDKVSHSRLHYGMRNFTLSWITDFLHSHTQDVVLDGQTIRYH